MRRRVRFAFAGALAVQWATARAAPLSAEPAPDAGSASGNAPAAGKAEAPGNARAVPDAEAPQNAQPKPPATETGATGGEAGTGNTSVSPPHALADLYVEYPQAETGDVEVILELVIADDGHVEEARVVTGREPFGGAAADAARAWRFAPAMRAGKPVRARIRVQVLFTEPERAPAPPEAPEQRTATESPRAGAPAGSGEEPTLEVVVEGQRAEASRRLTRAEVRQLPGAFGDPFRAIEILPGVTPVASGLPYFFVRGAPPGNVGYYFDQIQVPGLYHVAAGPAVIHPAFVDDVRLYSGAYPARYGRFAGGIVGASSAQPENRFRGEANVRLVDAGAMLEIPFADQRGNVMLAGRYSYTGLIVSLLAPEVEIGYWDYQGRIQYRFTDRDTVTLFGFGSYDFLGAETDGKFQDLYDVIFHRAELRYDRRLSDTSALRIATTVGSDRIHALEGRYLIGRTIRPRLVYSLQPSSKVALQAGADVQLRSTKINVYGEPELPQTGPRGLPIDFEPRPLPGLPRRRARPNEDTEAALATLFSTRRDLVGGGWVECAFDVGSGVSVTPGFRLDVYSDSGVTQLAPEPRINARFQINRRIALVNDLGVAHQPPSFVVPIPGLQGAASDGLQLGVQSSAGIQADLGANIAVSLTGFQNALFGTTDALGLANLQRADDAVTNDTARTTGHTYGAELLVKRPLSERLGGFLSYTLSRSTRSVDRLEGPSSFDRTHVLNAALAYDIGKGWRVGGRAAFYTGIPSEVAYPAAAKHPPRTPPFYRFDWRLEKRWALGETGFWAVVLEVLNTTLHEETLDQSCYAYGCQGEAIGPVTIPSIGLEASF